MADMFDDLGHLREGRPASEGQPYRDQDAGLPDTNRRDPHKPGEARRYKGEHEDGDVPIRQAQGKKSPLQNKVTATIQGGKNRSLRSSPKWIRLPCTPIVRTGL
jgi:hypothetical protein